MSTEPEYRKGTCYECGGSIEYPSNVTTEEVPCPHCGKLIMLSECHNINEPSTKPPIPSISQNIPKPAPMPERKKTVEYDRVTGTFKGSCQSVMRLASRAIQSLGWTITNANDTIGMITFETKRSWGSWSGITASVTVNEVGDEKFTVSGTAKQNVRGGQVFALDLFGESQGKIDNVINKMIEMV